VSLSADLERYRAHSSVGIARIEIGANALANLEDVVRSLPAHSSVAVLTDEVSYTAASGLDLKPALIARLEAIMSVTRVVLSGDVHADEETVARAVAGCADADLVVTIGSGTMCDIGKVAAGTRPHVVVQTAASVNGFADDQSVLLINGVKRTTHSAWPNSLVVDNDVLQGAPLVLNRSGLGDMISMFTAPADWYLASLVDMDRGWSSEAAQLTRRYGETVVVLLASAEANAGPQIAALPGVTVCEHASLTAEAFTDAGVVNYDRALIQPVQGTVQREPGAAPAPAAVAWNALGWVTLGCAGIVGVYVWQKKF